MEVDLMFFDCMNINGGNNLNQGKKNNNNESANKDNSQAFSHKSAEEQALFNESKCLSSNKYLILDAFEGIHEFVPIFFQE